MRVLRTATPVQTVALQTEQNEPVHLRSQDAQVAQVGVQRQGEGDAVERDAVVAPVRPVHVWEERNAAGEEGQQHHAAVSFVQPAVLKAELGEQTQESLVPPPHLGYFLQKSDQRSDLNENLAKGDKGRADLRQEQTANEEVTLVLSEELRQKNGLRRQLATAPPPAPPTGTRWPQPRPLTRHVCLCVRRCVSACVRARVRAPSLVHQQSCDHMDQLTKAGG